MMRVGIIGFGFMGRMHHRCWRALPDVRIVALCDPDAAALQSGGGPRGNIAGASEVVDLSGVALYTDRRTACAPNASATLSITTTTCMTCRSARKPEAHARSRWRSPQRGLCVRAADA